MTAGAALVALMAGIVGNAMLFQKGHHPAPLFGGAARIAEAEPETGSVAPPPPKPVASAPAAAIPASEPAAPDGAPEAAPPPARKPAMRPAVAAAKPISPPHSRPARGEDGIAKLLSGAKPGDAKDGSASVLTAQKALRKLGYSVDTDGRLGAATRQAISRFAQQHSVKAGDGVSPALLHELAVASGSPPG